jgi:ribose transport system substrate-binding protein
MLVGVAVAGCSHTVGTGAAAPGASATGGTCPSVVATARATVAAASDPSRPWNGPTTGPTAAGKKLIVYVAQDMTNPGVAGAAAGVQAAGKAIGWNVRVIDGQGTPSGNQAAFSQALTLNPAGIVIGGFDPSTTSVQVAQANAAHIPLIGWQAETNPGPSANPKLFTNVTTRVQDVAKASADYVIARSNGTAGVIVFTDKSIPFAGYKSDLIVKELQTCNSVKLLSTQNIPLADVTSRMPAATTSLVSQYGSKWNYSIAINDSYFENAAPALQASNVGPSQIVNVGAGDGDPSALDRIRKAQYQDATVPSPLASEGWQIIDEFNRAFHGDAPSGYVPMVHLATTANLKGIAADSWNPVGYQAAYLKIWGK